MKKTHKKQELLCQNERFALNLIKLSILAKNM